MRNIGWLFLCLVMFLVGCEKYDDSDLRNDVQNLENRVNALERWQGEVNSNLTSLQSIANALNGADYLTSITDLKDDSGKVIGYTLQFAKSGTKTIYHGKDGANGQNGQDGKDGQNGQDGKDGQNGVTPLIGLKIHSDGAYYWTLNGEWLLDANGKMVKASGKDGAPGKDGLPGQDGQDGNDGADGKDGITPKLKIEDDYWYVSYDNGTTWEKLGIAVSDENTGSTACIFKSVSVSDNYITFVLADGNSFALPYGDRLSISFSGKESFALSLNSTTEIGYEVESSTKKVDIEVIATSDLLAEVVPDDDSFLKGKIKVTVLGSLNYQSKVVVLVSNGNKFVMRSLTFEKEVLEITDNTERLIGKEGGEFTLEFMTNMDYDVIVSDDAKSWITSLGARAVTKHTLGFRAAKNTGNLRTGTVTIRSRSNGQQLVYNITQDGANSLTFTDDNSVMPCAGVLTAEFVSGNPEKGIDKIVDNDFTTCYEISGKSQFSFIWEGQQAKAMERIYVHFGDDPNKQPEGIVIYGSQDGKSWDYLLGVGSSNLGFWNDEFPSKTRYKFVKLEVNNPSLRETIAVAEFHLTPAADIVFTSFADVLANGSSFTENASTPMGNHYADKHVTTQADKTWLRTATNEPNLLESASGYTWRTYTVDLYPYDTPLPADVNQHGIGDCSALAVFAQMAYMFPDFIKSIITDHGNGTYTVKMFDPQGLPVDVTVQSTFLGDENGIGAASGKKGEATWATVLEKAIMKWNYIYQVNPDISGIGSEHVAPLFTGDGRSFAYYPNSLTADNLQKAVELCLDENMLVIGGFTTGGLYVGNSQTVTMHAYSFFLSEEAEALFAMRNPWGFSPGTNGREDGIMNIKDDGIVPPTIDIRIIYPGIAEDYAKSNLSPYLPPQW